MARDGARRGPDVATSPVPTARSTSRRAPASGGVGAAGAAAPARRRTGAAGAGADGRRRRQRTATRSARRRQPPPPGSPSSSAASGTSLRRCTQRSSAISRWKRGCAATLTSCSSLATSSKARSRSSREKRAGDRPQPVAVAFDGELRIRRSAAGSICSTIRSRTRRASSRQTWRRSWPDSTSRPATSNTRGASSSATTSSRSSSTSRSTRPSTSDTVRRVDLGAAERHHLIEGALRVAHAALGGAGDQRDRLVGDGHLLGVGDAAQLIDDRPRADRAQLEDLRPRQDRLGDLVQLGRRHHEDDVRRRLLHRLEERVERRVRELVDFVDDEDLVAIARRPHLQAVDDHLADVVDAGVRRGVDLEHVEVAAFGDLDAGVADAARLRRRPLLAVERAGQDAGGGRLADAAGAGEHERLRDAAGRDGVAEGLRDALLPDHLVEALRPPLARENLVRHVSSESVGIDEWRCGFGSGARDRERPYRDPDDLRHMADTA